MYYYLIKRGRDVRLSHSQLILLSREEHQYAKKSCATFDFVGGFDNRLLHACATGHNHTESRLRQLLRRATSCGF